MSRVRWATTFVALGAVWMSTLAAKVCLCSITFVFVELGLSLLSAYKHSVNSGGIQLHYTTGITPQCVLLLFYLL